MCTQYWDVDYNVKMYINSSMNIHYSTQTDVWDHRGKTRE